MSIVIPDKTYFKIGEVAKLIEVKPYILRYWESEFRVLRPQKSRSRHRLYRRKDVEILLQIKHLLYEEKYTVAGAKGRISELLSEGTFVPGRSGLAITESEASEQGDRIGEQSVPPARTPAPVGSHSEPDEGVRRALDEARITNQTLSGELDGMRSHLRELDGVQEKAAGAEERRVEAEARLATQDGRVVEVEDALAQAQTDLTELRMALTALTSERDGLLATRSRLREKIMERKEGDQELESMLESKTVVVHEMSERNGVLEAQLTEAESDAIRWREVAVESQNQVAFFRDVELERDALREKVTWFESALSGARTELGATVEELAEVTRLREAADLAADATESEMHSELTTQKERVESLRVDVGTWRALAQGHEATEHALSGLSTKRAELEDELDAQRAANTTLVVDLRSELIELRGVLAAY